MPRDGISTVACLRGSTGDLEASYWLLLPLAANECEKISLPGHGAEHQFSIQNVRSWAWITPQPGMALTGDSCSRPMVVQTGAISVMPRDR